MLSIHFDYSSIVLCKNGCIGTFAHTIYIYTHYTHSISLLLTPVDTRTHTDTLEKLVRTECVISHEDLSENGLSKTRVPVAQSKEIKTEGLLLLNELYSVNRRPTDSAENSVCSRALKES